MDANRLGRLFKGEEYDIDIKIPYSGETFTSFELKFFTDSASTFNVPFNQLRAEGNIIHVNIQENDFDVLADGVLRYYMDYIVNDVETILSTNTMHYLKTPDGYSGKTAEDIYNEGYHDGIEAAGGDYTEGYNAGIDYQKSKLISIEITENGTFVNADGYSGVTVDVPQQTFVGQEKNYNIIENCEITIRPDLGFDGITGGTITVNTPGHSDAEMEESFESGYTEGYGEGYESGETHGYDIGYETGYTEGYSSGTTDGYNEGYPEGYESGTTDGYNEGYPEGYESGSTDGYNTGYDAGYPDGYTSGTTDGFESGFTEGYASGVPAGAAEQKSKMISTAITENGLYEREDGYNSVSVAVPQTGHTDEEMEESYESGYTDGYTSGNTDGYNTGYPEGYASGTTDGYNEGYETGYTQGYTSGETDGYNEGYTDGYASGDTQGYESGYTEGYSEGYTSGNTDGYNTGYASGETYGMAEQKALLVSSAFTANGTYTRENGWNEVTVDVPTTEVSEYTKKYSISANGTSDFGTTIDFNYDYSECYGCYSGYSGLYFEYTISGSTPSGTYDLGVMKCRYRESLWGPWTDVSALTITMKDGVLVYRQTPIQNQMLFRVSGYGTTQLCGVQRFVPQYCSIEFVPNSAITFGNHILSAVTVDIDVPTVISGMNKTYSVSANGNHTFDTSLNPTVSIPSGTKNSCTITTNGELPDELNYLYYIYAEDDDETDYSSYIEIYSLNGTIHGDDIEWNRSKYGSVNIGEFGTYVVVDFDFEENDYGWFAEESDSPLLKGREIVLDNVKVNVNVPKNVGTLFAHDNNTMYYAPDNGYDGYREVFVEVTGGTCNLMQNKYIDHSGIYNAQNDDGVDGYEEVFVDVQPNVISKTITQDGTYDAQMDDGVDGYNTVVVQVDTSAAYNNGYNDGYADGIAYQQSLLSQTAITQNGLYTNSNGWDEVSVNITSPAPSSGAVGNMLHFVAEDAGSTIALTIPTGMSITLYKSTDGVNFTSWDGSAVTLSNVGDTLWLYGNNATMGSGKTVYNCNFVMSGRISAHGDVTYLLQYGGTKTLSSPSTFCGLFLGCAALMTAPELPATTLSDHCYEFMFERTSIRTAPVLPATTLARFCYAGMFKWCIDLLYTPQLPATTMVQSCYEEMFRECHSLTTGTTLPATTLAQDCYNQMFFDAVNMSHIEVYATSWDSVNYSDSWLDNVSANGYFYKPTNTVIPTGNGGVPNGWTVIDL